MEYDRLPLIDDSSAEFVKMLSISVLEHGAILFGIVKYGESELEYIPSKTSIRTNPSISPLLLFRSCVFL